MKFNVILFFTLVVFAGAMIDMLANQTTTTSANSQINEFVGPEQLTLADVDLGDNDPIGKTFGGNFLQSPAKFNAWMDSITLNYYWLTESRIGILRYFWNAVTSAFGLFMALKTAGAILNFLPFRRG
tara:strand:+ start:11108 stop:11488 length:381 start_codon:yes stop_codon:yes gene_type:complete